MSDTKLGTVNNQRTYSKKEISRILNKASEIQTQKDLYGDKEGLNAEELVEIAKEVGIDHDSLFQALQNFDNPSIDTKFNWLSGSSKIQDISFIDGEINTSNWELIVQEIRKINGGIGKTSMIGSSFEWEQRMKEIGYKHISLTPDQGKTKIQYVSGWNGLKMLSMFIPSFFGFISTLLFFEGIGFVKDLSMILGVFGGVLGFGLGRNYLKSYFKKQKHILQSIKKSITKTVQQTEASSDRIIMNEDSYDSTNNTTASLASKLKA